MTDESVPQHAAQQRIAEIVDSHGVLIGGGLALWRAYDTGAVSEPAAAISADLDGLDVPHVVVPAFRPPTSSGGRTRLGQEVRITSEDLPRLLRWVSVSSLHPRINGLPTVSQGFAFTYLEPRGA